jgi:hypothetical protein
MDSATLFPVLENSAKAAFEANGGSWALANQSQRDAVINALVMKLQTSRVVLPACTRLIRFVRENEFS